MARCGHMIRPIVMKPRRGMWCSDGMLSTVIIGNGDVFILVEIKFLTDETLYDARLCTRCHMLPRVKAHRHLAGSLSDAIIHDKPHHHADGWHDDRQRFA